MCYCTHKHAKPNKTKRLEVSLKREKKKIHPHFPACVSSAQCTPSPQSVPGSEANPRSLCQQKSQSLICAHLWSDAPPLQGPRLSQAPLPAPRLPQVPRPRANQRLPKWKKIKVILSHAEPWRIGDKQGKRAARLSEASYRVDTQRLLVTQLESVYKKLCISLA